MDNTGRLYVWKNHNNQEIVVMCTENNEHIVVHSDGLARLGTYVSIDNSFSPFIGTVNMVSKEDAQ